MCWWLLSWLGCVVVVISLSTSTSSSAFVVSSLPSQTTTSWWRRANNGRFPFLWSAAAGASVPTEQEQQQQQTESLQRRQRHQQQDTNTTTTTTKTTTILAHDADFVKSDPDARQYRAMVLPNHLQVLLVSAPDSDVEAGAVHVQAGHMDDPTEFPGLAHFHEHLLFLGTEKYPEEDAYEQYLSQHGGHSNAYTDMEDTNFYFSITTSHNSQEEEEDDDDDSDNNNIIVTSTTDALAGALDRLAQFFVAPTFDENMVERELRAVDSEYRNSLTSDAWRNYQLLKDAANTKHCFGKFGCGNYETLTRGRKRMVNATTDIGEPGNQDQQEEQNNNNNNNNASPALLEALKEFWKEYYVTTNLRLCVLGRSSLDELQAAVEKTFGQLPVSEKQPRRRELTTINKKDRLGEQEEEEEEERPFFTREHSQYGGVPAFGEQQLGRMRETIPLTESRVVKVHFAAPPLDDPALKESRPYRVISHLLGHESPGSLHALLNEEGLLMGLTSGIGIDTSDFSLFSLTLSLTPKGMQQRDRVLDLVFQWIALIRQAIEEGKMEAYHDELREISNVNFKFRENGDPIDFCSAAAELLFDYEPKDILVGTSRTGNFDPAVATEFLKRMRPENALIMVVNSDLKPEGEWTREKWYGAKYRDTTLSDEELRRWGSPAKIDSRLHLPALNQYVPKDFSLRCDDDPTAASQPNEEEEESKPGFPPKLLITRPDLRMWHKMDRTWRVPKTFIRLSILSPTVYRSPRTMTLSRVYQRVLNDDLNSLVYDANVAGCDYSVSCVPTGYRVSIKGFSEKLPFLLDTLTVRMLSLIQEMKEGASAHPGLALKFEKARQGLLRETKNYRLDSPYEVAGYNARLVLEKDVWYISDYIDEMEGGMAEKDPLTLEECAHVAEECLRGRMKAEALCIGNINEDGAKKVAEVVDRNLLKATRPLLDQETPEFRSVMIPTRSEAIALFGESVAKRRAPLIYQELALNESEENSSVEFILQTACDSLLGYEGVAILDLIAHIAYNSAYNQLRTKEQLGYIVSASVRKSAGGSWGLSVVVQSSVAEPSVLEERIEAWLEKFRQELEEMDPEDIAVEARAVIAQLLERDTKLSQEVTRLWGEILLTETCSERMKGNPPFDRMERVAEALMVGDASDKRIVSTRPTKTADHLKTQVLAFFDRFFAIGSAERRALSSRTYSLNFRSQYEENLKEPGVLSSYADISHLKQFLATWPVAPYWAAYQNR